MIIITGQVDIKPEHRDAAQRLGIEHSARSRTESGCVAHNCFVDAEAPDRLHFFEKWQDMAAVQAHFAVPEARGFIQGISSFAASPPKIEVFEVSEQKASPF